jgi:splicing factor 3B subunit 2
MKEHHPGVLSDQLKIALGMPSEGVPVPPPWLINMQRYGPPRSYPNLKIPGLNAPIPPGAQFGYHPGKAPIGLLESGLLQFSYGHELRQMPARRGANSHGSVKSEP